LERCDVLIVGGGPAGSSCAFGLRDSGLDVLILDALRHRPHVTHFGLQEAVEVAQSLGAKRTFFTHICHDLDHDTTCAALPDSMALAYDGMRLPLT
jgi:phosphoribosyl 1,2-cyclic phosphate phosphodiesterase